jgi:hypothetical protein
MPWQSNNITYSDSVSVAVFIQHAMLMHRTIFSSVACLVLPYFSIFSTVQVLEKINEHKTVF